MSPNPWGVKHETEEHRRRELEMFTQFKESLPGHERYRVHRFGEWRPADFLLLEGDRRVALIECKDRSVCECKVPCPPDTGKHHLDFMWENGLYISKAKIDTLILELKAYPSKPLFLFRVVEAIVGCDAFLVQQAPVKHDFVRLDDGIRRKDEPEDVYVLHPPYWSSVRYLEEGRVVRTVRFPDWWPYEPAPEPVRLDPVQQPLVWG